MPSTFSIFLVLNVVNSPTGGSVPVITGRSSIASFQVNAFEDTMNRFGLREEGGKLEREHVCARNVPDVDTHRRETCHRDPWRS